MIKIIILLLTYLFRCFHECLQACFQLHEYTVHQPTSDTPSSSSNHTRYKIQRLFQGLYRCFRGYKYCTWVPASESPPYRNRKGNISQNLLAVGDFNLEFAYILSMELKELGPKKKICFYNRKFEDKVS